MAEFNFDEVIDRKNTSCLKYDFAVERGYKEDILPFWVADMDFKTPQPVIDELTKRVAHGIYGYTDPNDEYKTAVVNWQKTQHSYAPSKESIVVTPGVVFALAMAVRAFTNAGDSVIIEQPVYYPFTEIVEQNHRKIVNSPLVLRNGHYEIDFADFEEKITANGVKLFLLCSPHNPAGRVWKKEELLKLADICTRHNVLIVADEIHADFVRKGYKHIPLASLSPAIANRVITCSAASKTFNLAGLQTSNIFIENEPLREKFRAEISAAGYSQPNVLGLFATQAAYEHGGAWLSALKKYLEQNYQRTKEFLAKNMPKVNLIEPEGTYLIWLDFSAYGLSDSELDRIIIDKANLWLDSGHIFGKAGENFQRINTACPWSVLENGLKHLADAFKNL